MIKLRNGTVAVLDIGSSKIACLIARIDGARPPVILGIGHQRSQGIKSGLVVDIQAAENAILAAVHAAEKMAGVSIEEVVANLSAASLTSHTLSYDIDIGGHEVTMQDIHRILDQARAEIHQQDHTILHTIPYGYSIDGNSGITNPIGMYGQSLKSQVHLVTAPMSVVRNLQHCLARCSLHCQEVVAAGFASGFSALTEDERQLGSLLLDMGGGTTNIAIFEGGNLLFTGSVPIGGMHITKDIARGLSTSISYAERVKTLYGNLLSTLQDDTISLDMPEEEGNESDPEISHIARSALVGIIRPRVEEMLEMLAQYLQQYGYHPLGNYRVVLTGGGSQLTGIRELVAEYFQAQTRLSRPQWVEGLAESVKGPGFSSAVGLVHYVRQMQPQGGANEKEGLVRPPAMLSRLIRWFQQNF